MISIYLFKKNIWTHSQHMIWFMFIHIQKIYIILFVFVRKMNDFYNFIYKKNASTQFY